MKLTKLTPMLYTSALQETVDFYVDILGFSCLANETEWGWAMVKKGEVEVMFSIPNERIPFEQANFTGSFYINTDNVDECWTALNYQAKVCYPIEDFDYGMREFAIYDNNGYLLQFGQALEERD